MGSVTDSLALSGDTSTRYDGSLTFTTRSRYQTEDQTTTNVEVDVIVKNPCIDPAYVTIGQAVLLDKIYELYENDPVGFQFTHDEFTINTVPIAHTLCGGLTYESRFDGTLVDNDEKLSLYSFGAMLKCTEPERLVAFAERREYISLYCWVLMMSIILSFYVIVYIRKLLNDDVKTVNYLSFTPSDYCIEGIVDEFSPECDYTTEGI